VGRTRRQHVDQRDGGDDSVPAMMRSDARILARPFRPSLSVRLATALMLVATGCGSTTPSVPSNPQSSAGGSR
jgi:hypothetical protein